MKPNRIALTLLAACAVILMAAVGSTTVSYFKSVSVSATNYVSEQIVTNGLTLGGVRNTAWPAGGLGTNVTDFWSSVLTNSANTNAAAGLAALGGSSTNSNAGLLYGLDTIINSTNAIDVGVGYARSSDNMADIVLSGTITKTNAAWVAGSGNGGLASGSQFLSNSWYYIYVIRRPDSGTTDVLFSTNKSTPTLPANYTQFRRIWSFFASNTNTIRPYVQQGDYGYWSDAILDLDTTSPAVVWTLLTVSVPPITGILARENVICRTTENGGPSKSVGVASGVAADPSQQYLGDFTVYNYITNAFAQAASLVPLQVNSGGQIKYNANTASSHRVIIYTRAWVDSRGR